MTKQYNTVQKSYKQPRRLGGFKGGLPPPPLSFQTKTEGRSRKEASQALEGRGGYLPEDALLIAWVCLLLV